MKNLHKLNPSNTFTSHDIVSKWVKKTAQTNNPSVTMWWNTIPSGPGYCQTTSGHNWPGRHEAGRGRKVKSAAEGKERNTRVGIVGILTARPTQLPVICFVVNANSRGGIWLTVLQDTSRRLSSNCRCLLRVWELVWPRVNSLCIDFWTFLNLICALGVKI